MFTKFEDIFAELAGRGAKKRMIAAWGVDGHTISAAAKAVELGMIEATLVGDENLIREQCEKENIDMGKFTIVHNPSELPAVAQAVSMINQGMGDILMKGLCSTDKFMRAILNKETGLLPPKAVLSHVSVIQNPNYHKLIILGDMAVIPLPDLSQKKAILGYLVNTAHAMGIACPKVAILAATEQMLEKMPACAEAAILAKKVDRGEIKGCVADGPLALDVAIDPESVEIKHLVSPVAGDADCGAKVPCVLSSRADSIDTKLNSIAIAAMSAK